MSAGQEEIVGHYVGPGVTCPQFELETGETVSLSGIYDKDMSSGVQIRLVGSWSRVSTCMQGREFSVSEVRQSD